MKANKPTSKLNASPVYLQICANTQFTRLTQVLNHIINFPPGTHPLTKKPEDSGYEIAVTSFLTL